MKTLIAIAMYIMLTAMSVSAAITTNIPLVVHQPVVKATLLINDLFPYVGSRIVSINGMIVDKDFDDTYNTIVHLVNGTNFVRIIVVDGQHKYSKTKKVVYTRRWTKGKLTAAAPVSHRHTQLALLKDAVMHYKDAIMPPDDPMDTKAKFSIKGKPPIPLAGIPFLKKDDNFNFLVTMKVKFY